MIIIEDCLSILKKTDDIFCKEKSILSIPEEDDGIVIVGDTHGDFEMTKKVLDVFSPEEYYIVFNGDYVDRGPNSIENINYLLEKKCEYPSKLFLTRGNHETPQVNNDYGFLSELSAIFPESSIELHEKYNKMFSQLPYGVIIENYKILVIHGGIPKEAISVDDLKKMPKNDLSPTNEMAFQVLWNDPKEGIDEYSFIPSTRGDGAFLFSKNVVKSFLENSGLNAIIRSHEYFKEGYKFFFKDDTLSNKIKGFEGLVLTVFSSYRDYGVNPHIAILENKELKLESILTIGKNMC